MDLIKESAALVVRYQELQQYVGWCDEDVHRVKGIRDVVWPDVPALIDDFYREIGRHPEARKVITGGEEQVERLKGTLVGWLDELFSGNYDASYVVRRWKVGWRHVEIGLSQVYTNVALSRLREGLFRALHKGWRGEANELSQSIRSLSKLLDLDLAIIEEAYQAEYLKRQQQNERLAAIGQMSGGVAHELRNPLNVIKTSIYFLLNAKTLTPEKTAEHLQRIQRQVDVADSVTTALSDFAKLPLPTVESFPLEPCLREVLEIHDLPSNIQVNLQCEPDLPLLLADRRQMMVVFGNLIRNSRDAMPGGGDLTICASDQGDRVEITISDTGEGIQEEVLKRILEPLFSTKARGIGLGLAITRTILDRHHAELRVNSEPGVGTSFVVSLPSTTEDQLQ